MISIVTALALGAALMMGGISQGFGDLRSRTRQGIPGDWVYSDHTKRWGSGINSTPQKVQIVTSTVSDPGDDQTITISIAPTTADTAIDVTINTGTDEDATSLAEMLAAAINLEPLIRGSVRASSSGTTLTLTGLNPGAAFTVTESSASLTTPSTTQVADEADPVPFGRAVIHVGDAAGETEPLVTVPYASLFSAQVITATIVNGVATTRAVRVWEIRGPGDRVLMLETVYLGSATEATEATNLAAAVELAAPANTVVAAVAASVTVTFTAEVPGTEILVEIEQVNAGDVTFANTTGPSEATSLNRAWRGISLYDPASEAPTTTSTEGQYAPNAGVRFGYRGVIWVASSESPSPSADVYVELAAGSTQGRFYVSGSSTRVALSRRIARWERDGLVAADALAAIRLEA